ncbi:hypothetical protein FA15DRAFT_655566 [Coprinopsis marcescibilis]|uniref:G domain-containing protein n=1 Tax=Coprinopsis marcescibilis TaxID=230819 RepID=A0A5C3KW82_COPMA|nr:hypothetical protein FA15DRAFT_655566 [Coprinopsis marcescibilis]
MHHNPHSSPHYTNGDAVIIKSLTQGSIMGPPGSGKSTFINNIVQSGVATTDSGLDPCTQKFGWHLVPMKSPIYKTANHMGIRRIFLIDTPGIESAGLCQDIRGVLGRALKNGVVAVGLMYLCRYDRIREGDQVYMRAFKKLCEMDCHVLVGLTHLGAADAPQRASKALSHNTSWKPFLEATGADAVCLMDSAESAEVVLAGLLRSRPASKYGHDSSAIADEPGLLKFFKRLGNKVNIWRSGFCKEPAGEGA